MQIQHTLYTIILCAPVPLGAGIVADPLLPLLPQPTRTRTQDIIIYVTTLPHRGRVGPPPPKGVATTFNTATTKETKPPSPPPVGKAGFEVWVLTKGGLVSVHHCRLYRAVVHVHPLGRYAEP
jgi:hypothetical protein